MNLKFLNTFLTPSEKLWLKIIGIFWILLLSFNSCAPVVLSMTPSKIEIIDTKIIARGVTGVKIKDCKFAPPEKYLMEDGTTIIIDSFFGQVKINDVWVDIDTFEFLKDKTPYSSHAAGIEKQYFGDWKWDIKGIKGEVTAVRLVTKHFCGETLVISYIGDWDISHL